jgi:four helix bundle protein
MAFQVEELSLELIEALVPLMPRIKQHDKNLADQLRRAASSIGLNCAEAAFSDPGNRGARLFTAAGSAGETRHALRQSRGLANCNDGGRRKGAGVVEADRGDPLENDSGITVGKKVGVSARSRC